MKGKTLNVSVSEGMFVVHKACTERVVQTHFCVWTRLLEEEATKRAELEQIHLRQQRAISETEAEKQELEKERLAKESALQAAMEQLDVLEQERRGALEQYQVSQQQEPHGYLSLPRRKHKTSFRR